MWNERRRLNYWLSAWLPAAVCVGVIYVESTAAFGAEYTSGPLRALYEALFGHMGNAQWEVVHLALRKSGHFLGYGVMGLAWLRAWRMTLIKASFVQDVVLALLSTGVVASADEWHQTYLPNRTGTPRDVLLDICGALTLQLAFYLFLRFSRSRQREKGLRSRFFPPSRKKHGRSME